MQGDIEYVTDSFLIERTIFALYENQAGIEKRAFLEGMLGGLASSIQSWVGAQIHGKDAAGVGKTVVNFLVPTMFFRAHPLLGIAATAAQTLGFDLVSVFQKIVDTIKPKIEQGEPVSASEINEAAKSAMPSDIQADASLLYPLTQLESFGYFDAALLKTARRPRQGNMVSRMFSGMGRKRGGSIIVGILAWFIKTVLLSAGLLAAGGMVASMFGKEPPNKSEENFSGKSTTTTTEAPQAAQRLVQRSTGAGGHVWKSKPGDAWIEELDPGEKPFQRILRWTYASFPDLSQYQDIILRTPSFWNAVQKVKAQWGGERQLEVPDPFKKRDDVINLFVNDVYRAINEGIT